MDEQRIVGSKQFKRGKVEACSSPGSERISPCGDSMLVLVQYVHTGARQACQH